MSLRFGEFRLDLERYTLSRGDEALKVEPKTFDVLVALIRDRRRVVTKDELLDRVWAGEAVSESVLPTNVALLRRLLGDDRSAPRFIKTVHGRGYQFVADVVEEAAAGAGGDPADSVFVGRDGLIRELIGHLDQACASNGRLVLLVGEPGIGKTRTIDELAKLARSRGVGVLGGRCYEGEGAPAFWPWVQILRAAIASRSPEQLDADLGRSAEDIAQLLPELRIALPDTPLASVDLAPAEARFRLFDAVERFLFSASAVEPLLVVLDDLHWGDQSSLLLLRFLARDLRDARLLLVGAYRDMEVRRGQPLAQLLGELASEPLCRRLPLGGLDRDAVGRCLERVAGAAPSPEQIAEVYARTGGNPYFVGEIARLLRSEGEVHGRLPEGVRDAIGRRLDALGADCNALLSHAALFGSEVEVSRLAHLLDWSRDRVLDALDEALEARLVREAGGGGGRYAFEHALVRETLYEELSAPRRLRLHRRVGAVLESLHAEDLDAVVDELAHHYYRAAAGGEGDKAVEYGRRAATRARSLLAYEEAARHLERVIEVLELEPPVDPRLLGSLLLELGHTLAMAARRELFRSTFLRAAEVAKRSGSAEMLAEAAVGMGGIMDFGWGRDLELVALLEEADAALGDAESDLKARVLARLSGVHPRVNDPSARVDYSTRALAMARRVGGRIARMESLEAWSFDQNLGPLPGDWLAHRTARAEELFEIAKMPADTAMWAFVADPEWFARSTRFTTCLMTGDIASADRELEACARIAARQRYPYQQFHLLGDRSGRAHGDGRFEDALRLLREEGVVAKRLNPTARSYFIAKMFAIARDRGEGVLPKRLRDRGAIGVILESVRREFPFMYSSARAMHACMEWLGGNDQETRRAFEEMAAEDFRHTEKDFGFEYATALQAELAVALGEREAMQTLYERLAPWPQLNVMGVGGSYYLGSASHFLGVLAAGLDRLDVAESHLRDAFAMNERMGARAHAARTRLELAAVQQRRGGHRAEVDALLRESGEAISALGLEPLRARHAALARS